MVDRDKVTTIYLHKPIVYYDLKIKVSILFYRLDWGKIKPEQRRSQTDAENCVTSSKVIRYFASFVSAMHFVLMQEWRLKNIVYKGVHTVHCIIGR